jgi:sortase A
MSERVLRHLTRFLTFLGVLLMLAGGVMWWRQVRLEADLLGREERVLLAVTAEDVPFTLPEYGIDRVVGAPPTVESAVISPTALVATPAVSATVPSSFTGRGQVPQPEPDGGVDSGDEPEPTPTPDAFPPAQVLPGRLVIPAINLETSVVQMGWEVRTDANGNEYSEWVVPEAAAGWHQNSVLPGHGSNMVLSGHHNVAGEVFRYIVDLEPGDEVILQGEERNYRYVVEEKYIVKERGEPLEVRMENNRFIEPTPDERLTLVSCWPYESNTHRVIVIARPRLDEAASGAYGAPAEGATP